MTRNWSREETLLAFHLYWRIPFGRQHAKAPEVQALAEKLGRSANSVAMKLNNFTSLDHDEQACGVAGLRGASKQDREIWADWQRNWAELALESEALWQNLHAGYPSLSEFDEASTPDGRRIAAPPPDSEWQGSSSIRREREVRLAQGFFRRLVLASYQERCCISGINLPALLVASHIQPWAKFPEQRCNPANGLCLSRLHDAAFDQGLLTLDEDFRLVLSAELAQRMSHQSLQDNFGRFAGQLITTPEKFRPEPSFLAWHREQVFIGA